MNDGDGHDEYGDGYDGDDDDDGDIEYGGNE